MKINFGKRGLALPIAVVIVMTTGIAGGLVTGPIRAKEYLLTAKAAMV